MNKKIKACIDVLLEKKNLTAAEVATLAYWNFADYEDENNEVFDLVQKEKRKRCSTVF